MTNAEKFQEVFGYYATEMWAKPEKEFLEWLNAEALEQEPSCRNTRQVDLISREQAIKEISDEFENEWEEADVNFNHGLNMALSIIKALSALDQDEIIQCKDCKHWHEWDNGTGSCHRSGMMWVGSDCDDYCSCAEPKGGDGE